LAHVNNISEFDVVVVGGGHAGIEACHAAWKLGVRTALLTMEIAAIGRMSCNPAVGGVAKGQIVRDIDALGGLMGTLTDAAGIQFRMLNSSKGPAVWGPRAQCDMELYSELARQTLESLPGLALLEGELAGLDREVDQALLLTLLDGRRFRTRKLVITSGTFLSSRMFTGLETSVGGRVGEASSDRLSASLHANGISLYRLKTGTPSRLDPDSIDFSVCEVQHGDPEPWAFSSATTHPLKNHAVCWITRTTLRTHEILRTGFAQSPMFTGRIQGLGPRYCPSIEDKINRFGDKDGHQLFLEPETRGIGRVYVNGFSSSLPAHVQLAALRSIPGLEQCRVQQIGYAVEYEAVVSTELHPTLEYRNFPGLYFAGQVCGTSGYEEAAAQGLMAGINAALAVQGREPFILGRADSYIGVMLDDLVSIPLEEPYRMFTSRAEYRLFLRPDNAEARLTAKARALGMVDDVHWLRYTDEQCRITNALQQLTDHSGTPEQINPILAKGGQAPVSERTRWIQVLRRPGVDPADFFPVALPGSGLTRRDQWFLLAEELYRGFFERQSREIEHQRKMENFRLAPDLDYMAITSLSVEARQKLTKHRPLTVGLASRVPGVRPADITVLVHWLDQRGV